MANLEIDITDLSRGGSGVARSPDGQVVFVPLTAPGDRILARVVRDEGRYLHAELLEILKPSPLRREARCPVFGRCGGCQWQHVPYSEQWRVKRDGALAALKRVGVPLPSDVTDFPAEAEFEYRNRIQLRGSAGSLGFFAPKSHELIEIETCPVARPEVNAALPAVRAEAATRSESPYKVEVEVLESDVAGESPVRWTWNARHGAAGFRQVNEAQNQALRVWISAQITPGRRLLDLFGGAGNLSLGLADRMTHVDCVDTGSPGADQRPPATPQNLTFHRSDVTRWLKSQPRAGVAASSVILDPPREGCGPQISIIIETIQKLRGDEILAVGCDPDSWAKDVGRWIRAGFRLEKAAFFDFFPQTPHIESVALLRRGN